MLQYWCKSTYKVFWTTLKS